MEKHNAIFFLIVSFWILKYKAAQETTTNESGNDERVIGLLIGFFSLLGSIAIFIAIWCYCCHYEKDKFKEKLPVRNVSVKPMVLPERTPPTVSKPQVEIDDRGTKEELQANEKVQPGENEDQKDDMPKNKNKEEDETQLESYRELAHETLT